MNDHQWQTEGDPFSLLAELYPLTTLGSDAPQTRACRLYLVACARRQWARLPGVCRGLVEVAEWYADAPRRREKMRAAVAPVVEQLMQSDGAADELARAVPALGRLTRSADADGHERYMVGFAGGAAELDPAVGEDLWRALARLVYLPFVPFAPPFAWVPADLHSADLVRETHYNPSRFVHFAPEWCTTNVLALARQMYDAREFGAMPILADALQDEGCDCGPVLAHCRDPRAGHTHGCWVLEGLLNRR